MLHGIFEGRHKNNYLCAPLFYGVVDVEFEENTFLVTVDFDACQINHDLISRLFDLEVEEEFDEESILPDNMIEKYNNVDYIENKYFDKDGIFSNIVRLLKDSSNLFNDFKENLPEFTPIHRFEPTDFNYRERNSTPVEQNEIKYYPFPFLFLNNVPHQLSTYESLNVLLHQRPIENILLKKLFQNILTDERVRLEFEKDIKEEQVLEVIDKSLPFSLSENQKNSIKKAWTSELSYIQGPPGTGKSYTIAAIILTAFLLGKKVLLVSHKDAAINVVKKMVDDILGDESILYLGSEDKSETKDYLETTVNEA